MPHFQIEYARPLEQSIDLISVMNTIHEVGGNSGIMDPADIKVRAIPYDLYLLAGKADLFIHITVSLLKGRTDEQKESLAIQLRSALAVFLTDLPSLSIDIRDMNSTAYKKRLVNK
jgi:5-carboxymethyl-2-hydroxymuconate isomerase